MNKSDKSNTELNRSAEEMITCISENGLIAPEEAREIIEAIRIEIYPKGHHLIKEGELVQNCFSLIIGCVRQYQIIDGVEKTTAFYTDGQGISSFTSASKKVASSYYFECLE